MWMGCRRVPPPLLAPNPCHPLPLHFRSTAPYISPLSPLSKAHSDIILQQVLQQQDLIVLLSLPNNAAAVAAAAAAESLAEEGQGEGG